MKKILVIMLVLVTIIGCKGKPKEIEVEEEKDKTMILACKYNCLELGGSTEVTYEYKDNTLISRELCLIDEVRGDMEFLDYQIGEYERVCNLLNAIEGISAHYEVSADKTTILYWEKVYVQEVEIDDRLAAADAYLYYELGNMKDTGYSFSAEETKYINEANDPGMICQYSEAE